MGIIIVGHISLFLPILRQFKPAIIPPTAKPPRMATAQRVPEPQGDLSRDGERCIRHIMARPMGNAVKKTPMAIASTGPASSAISINTGCNQKSAQKKSNITPTQNHPRFLLVAIFSISYLYTSVGNNKKGTSHRNLLSGYQCPSFRTSYLTYVIQL